MYVTVNCTFLRIRGSLEPWKDLKHQQTGSFSLSGLNNKA